MREKTIEYGSGGRVFSGFFVEPDAALAAGVRAVLVLHGGAGLGEHERQRARTLAELGYVALAPDLFGETFRDRAHGVQVITRLVEDPSVLRERVMAALAYLGAESGVPPRNAAIIGFCFGGLAALELARSGAEVAAVVAFHGGLTTRSPANPGEISCRVLVCTGSADPFVPREQRAAFEEEMSRAGADWQSIVYGGALHGFTEQSPTPRPGCAYDERADRRSWRAMRAWFEETEVV